MMIDELTFKYIEEHSGEDVHALALRKFPAGVDARTALNQIAARQKMRKKVPLWAENSGVVYPGHLSVEQCSSQTTAGFKAQIVDSIAGGKGFTLVDLTGGMGVDCYFMSAKAGRAVYVERDSGLCRLAAHNFGVLGRKTEVVNSEAEEYLCGLCNDGADIIYLDPARRDASGRKMVSLHDCSPDVTVLRDKLLKVAPDVLVKLSPMLDISLAVSELNCVYKVYVVSVHNECKELVIHLRRGYAGQYGIECVDFGNDGCEARFVSSSEEEAGSVPVYADGVGQYLYEPCGAVMKAGLFRSVAVRFGVEKLHPNSHLYTSAVPVEHFPGRVFEVEEVLPFSKRETARISRELACANIAVRNFPLTAEALRRKLGMKDGGEVYLFGTTLKEGDKVLIVTRKYNG